MTERGSEETPRRQDPRGPGASQMAESIATALSLSGVTKAFEGRCAVGGVNLTVAPGAIALHSSGEDP